MRALKEGGKRTVFAEEGFAKCYEGFSLGLKDVILVALLGAEDKQDEDEDGRKEAGSRLVAELEDGIFLNSSIGVFTTFSCSSSSESFAYSCWLSTRTPRALGLL